MMGFKFKLRKDFTDKLRGFFHSTFQIQLKKLQEIRINKQFIYTTLLILLLFVILAYEIILFTEGENLLSNSNHDDTDVDYNPPLTKEDEFRDLFRLIDSLRDGFITVEELEAFSLHKFQTYSASRANKNSELLTLDQDGRTEGPVENSLIQDSFLKTLDLNKDGILKNDELTMENVKQLFDKAKEIMINYDTDTNGLVTWEEFYQ